MSARQNWAAWFLEIKRLNSGAGRHEFPTKSVFVGDVVIATCARCGSSFWSKCSKESGPFSTSGAWNVLPCDLEVEKDAKIETKEVR